MNRGFTVLELMVAVALISSFSVISLSLWHRAHDERIWAERSQRDVVEWRRALASLAGDLRAAHRVAPRSGEGLRIERATGVVDWEVRGGSLCRIEGGGSREIAGRVRRFEATIGNGLVRCVLWGRGRRLPSSSVPLELVIAPRGFGGGSDGE